MAPSFWFHICLALSLISYAFLTRDGFLDKPVTPKVQLQEDWETILVSEYRKQSLRDKLEHAVGKLEFTVALDRSLWR